SKVAPSTRADCAKISAMSGSPSSAPLRLSDGGRRLFRCARPAIASRLETLSISSWLLFRSADGPAQRKFVSLLAPAGAVVDANDRSIAVGSRGLLGDRDGTTTHRR